VQPNGDRNAYSAVLSAGFTPRENSNSVLPLSCCLDNPDVNSPASAVSDFDHQVDHIMTEVKKVKLLSSLVTGLVPVNGLWDSDHAGVYSKLRMPPKKK
jgi:hypothetical protein